METVHIIRFGEIWIKGNNRRMFLQKLEANLRRVLRRNRIDAVLQSERGRLFVRQKSGDPLQAARLMARTPGVVSVSSGTRVEKEMGRMADSAMEQLKSMQVRPISFKVEAKRADKTFPMTSPELARELGGELLRRDIGIPVDIHSPAMVVGVEIQKTGAYVFCRTLKGAGGLPVGVSGRIALLLSGGIDSPVAGWRLQRRGAVVMPVYFHGFPFTSDKVKDKVKRLAAILADNQDRLSLKIVNFTPVLTALKQHAPDHLTIILMRRFMVRITEQLGGKTGCLGMATGDNLGQVASQTLENLGCISDAVSMLMLRPLLGMDKFDIVDEAKRLGTYEISIEPHEDCCTLFVPEHPEIYGKLEEVRVAEQALDIDGLVTACVEDVETVRFKGDKGDDI